MSHTDRIVLLIDMDCFFCQVEEHLNPDLKGKPLAVVQYNQWRGGGIIAVNYPARDKGVTRHMRGDDAKEKCPDIILVKVPDIRGKANLSKYRDAGKSVAEVLKMFTPLLERASVDEAYLDITSVVEKRIELHEDSVTIEKLLNTFVVGNSTEDFVENVTQHRTYDEANYRLALGGIIAEEIRAEVFKVTGYRCSAGIAHNKLLAKLVCGLHKPNKQTILPHESVPQLYKNTPIRKLTSLGGKFGISVMEKLNIQYLSELSKFTQRELAKKFDEKSAIWLFNIAKGIDTEPVNTRLIAKSIGCCKKFPGRSALCTKEDIEYWLNQFAEEMAQRLEKDLEENCRRAKQIVVNFGQSIGDEEVINSKSHPLNSYEQKRIFENALQIVQKNCQRADGSFCVIYLGLSIGHFQDVKKVKEITSFFKAMKEKTYAESTNKSNSGYQNIDENYCGNQDHVDKDEEAESADSSNSCDSVDQSHDSIYSQTTEEDDIGCDSLIFYEQIHPESIERQHLAPTETESSEDVRASDTSRDSISNEVSFQDIQGPSNVKDSTTCQSSFFNRYFTGTGCRNFNTSKSLAALDDSDEASMELDDIYAIDTEKDKSDSLSVEIEDRPYVDFEGNICPECGKTVESEDYQSHLDYHFVISMVKSEAHLYKNEPMKQQASSTTTKKAIKKKMPENLQKPIVEYFKNMPAKVQENPGDKFCHDCNRNILEADWDVHADFHAAKRLHLEINATHAKDLKERTVRTKFKGQKKLSGFLKTV